MESETKQPKTIVCDLQKRAEKMADGQRYIIYYTFRQDSPTDESPKAQLKEGNQKSSEVSENV
jgi:hypothetical protein